MAIEKQPFVDTSPIKNCWFSSDRHVSLPGEYRISWKWSFHNSMINLQRSQYQKLHLKLNILNNQPGTLFFIAHLFYNLMWRPKWRPKIHPWNLASKGPNHRSTDGHDPWLVRKVPLAHWQQLSKAPPLSEMSGTLDVFLERKVGFGAAKWIPDFFQQDQWFTLQCLWKHHIQQYSANDCQSYIFMNDKYPDLPFWDSVNTVPLPEADV